MNLTEQDKQILIILAQIKAGQIKVEPQDEPEVERLVNALTPDAKEIYDALQGKKTSREAKKIAEELFKWTQQNMPEEND